MICLFIGLYISVLLDRLMIYAINFSYYSDYKYLNTIYVHI